MPEPWGAQTYQNGGADMVGFAKTVVAVGTFSAVAMAVPHAAWDQPRTLRFNALTTHQVLLDRGRRGLSVGDLLVSVGRLVRPDGRLLGSFGTSCTVVDVDRRAVYQCDGHDSLPGGQIAFAGETVPGKRVQVIAITGGTGDYSQALGQLTLVRLGPKVTQVSMVILE
jgi:hypothetical protein